MSRDKLELLFSWIEVLDFAQLCHARNNSSQFNTKTKQHWATTALGIGLRLGIPGAAGMGLDTDAAQRRVDSVYLYMFQI